MKEITHDSHLEIYGENLIIPYYSDLEKDYCARYCRFLANDVFGISYLPKDSWNYPLHTNLISDIKKLDEMLEIFTLNKLSAGNVLLCKYPKSRYSNRVDENGDNVIGTHLCIYLGESLENNSHFFAHQYGKKQYVFSFEEFSFFKLSPKKILSQKQFGLI